ncbi:MAG: tetratricopeptide repeat protein [Candidatus Obscuribacterales bacterium]|nr:tetratricopeptide repeat protein [Candidatus Obscuribacterales bacterium]
MSDLLQQATDLLQQKDFAGSFLLAKEHWLQTPDDRQGAKLLSEIMKKTGRDELASYLQKLSADEESFCSNVQLLFETGYKLIDEREPELAQMLLHRCLEMAPEEAVIRYELGFALMQLRRFAEAIPHFEELQQKEKDFDTSLNLAVCHSLLRNLERAEELLKQLEPTAKSEEEQKELALRRWVIKRLSRFEAKHAMSIRDWVYSLYGSVILSDTTPKDLTGKPRAVAADYHGIASSLLILKGFLELFGNEFEVVEYYSPMSRPLAEALAYLLNVPAQSYQGPDRKERSLLMMAWASDIIGPHQAFIGHNPRRSIFAYGLTTLNQLPVTPDIIGCLAGECQMPWAEELDKAELKTDAKGDLPPTHPINQVQARAADRIIAHISNMESNTEIINHVEYLVNYYDPRRKFIVYGNADTFAERPEYTSEIPL